METGNAKAIREALESVRNWCLNRLVNSSHQVTVEGLLSVVNTALAKPPRNCDKYNTADEAYAGFRKFCDKSVCSKCRFDENPTTCRLSWLYSEVEKEESK